jgi:MFS family permease
VMFTLGGITIVLVPGSLPLWLVVAYVCLGAAGSVFVGWLATDRAFHIVGRLPQRAIMDGPAAQGTAAQAAAPAGERRRRVLVWAAGVAGTALAGTISAVLAVLVLDWLGR